MTPFTIKGTRAAAETLGVAASTLQSWLSKDEKRLLPERRFDFHHMRGPKRVWTEDGLTALGEAIDRESRDGVLSHWRTRASGARSFAADQAARHAMHAVLNHRAPRN